MKTVDIRVPVLDATLNLAVKIWYPAGVEFGDSKTFQYKNRCLAYPGWLDNVGSFENLAPLLCERLSMVIAVIDPPGCGWSDHRAAESPYADYEEPPLIGDVADALGWHKFGLMGHSRGGAIIAFAAGLFADRVTFAIALDSGLGLSGVWIKDLMQGAPNPVERMRKAREQHKRNRQRTEKVFASLDEAIGANAKNETFPKSLSTARNIVLRHIRPHAKGGYTFIHDSRTYGQSQFVCLTEDQTRAFLKEIRCPMLRIYAKEENARIPEQFRSYYAERYKVMTNPVEVQVVPGGHHVHSDNAPAVADAIVQWFKRVDLSGCAAAKL